MRTTVRLTRRVAFSSGHRYWFAHLSEAENRALFGPWASPYSHGHNYALWASFDGGVEPETGMVVNIKDLDAILQRVIVGQFDTKSLNDEVPFFANHAPTVENLLLYIRAEIEASDLPESVRLTHLKLEETPLLYGEHPTNTAMTISLTRVYEFAAAHRLHAEALPHARNLELYGKCNNPAGHGHNYVLEVTVEGEPNPETGMIADLGALDAKVEELVVDRYDHKNLNIDIPEFAGKITTSEVVVEEIFRRLDGRLPATLRRVRLYETARNVFEVER
jgi:6-pyruvoyltetrahydropterin/6-carboxytetrahydropterin synthase